MLQDAYQTDDLHIDDSHTDDSHTGDSRPQRHLGWLISLAIVVLVALNSYALADHYTSNWFALAPGSTVAVQDRVIVRSNNVRVHDHKGQVLFVTVSLRTVGPLSYVLDKLNGDIQLVNEKALVGNFKRSQLSQVNAVEMQQSTQTAVVVALRRIGYQVALQGLGAEVDQVATGSPADGHLQPGDVITALDSVTTPSNDALVTLIRKHQPGQIVRLTVAPPNGPQRSEDVRLAQSPPDQGPLHAFLGITTSTKQQAKLPVDVSVDPGNVGGPSAGLAFTLGVINKLGAGDLTGGQIVAATGTINSDGTVGDVGGVAQKTVAVRNAGASVFLVPPGEYQEAQRRAGSHLRVIRVTTLDDALNALRGLGGDLSALGSAPGPPR
jgi:PDZ domain-containing protein